ncbi:MAG TPA: hypothetical protein VKC82_06880, partial [Burkholderiales bacterium]|nr:hypothetical protein [Burkholderiales bacterium]
FDRRTNEAAPAGGLVSFTVKQGILMCARRSHPQSVARVIREDTIRWAKVIRDFDVKPEN